MKLSMIMDLKTEIEKLEDIKKTMEDDYLQALDDDLWTIDLETKPYFTEDYDVAVITDTALTRKYLLRFCEDYGLSLKDYKKDDVKKTFNYLFELEKDIEKSLNLL